MLADSRIIIADNSPLFRQGVRLVLQQFSHRALLVEADNLQSMLSMTKHYCADSIFNNRCIDLIIIDSNLNGLSDAKDLEAAFELDKRPPILMTTSHIDNKSMSYYFEQGIEGIVNRKSSQEDFYNSIISLLKGKHNHHNFSPKDLLQKPKIILSPREEKILENVESGMSNKEISDSLKLSEKTIKRHITSIYRKINFTNQSRTKLATYRDTEAKTTH